MKIHFIILTLLLYACSAGSKKKLTNSKEECLNYEPVKVQLEGLLYKASFPGPPNYEDIKKGDEEEVYWLIKTTKRFCVNKSEAAWGSQLSNQSEVQLIVDGLKFYNSKRHLLGKKIVLSGTLTPQMTGHHKTEVLLMVETLEKANE